MGANVSMEIVATGWRRYPKESEMAQIRSLLNGPAYQVFQQLKASKFPVTVAKFVDDSAKDEWYWVVRQVDTAMALASTLEEWLVIDLREVKSKGVS